MTCFPQKIPRAITIPHSKRVAIIIIFLYKNILIFKIQSDQSIHQNASIVTGLQKFLHEKYPITNVYLKYLFFI